MTGLGRDVLVASAAYGALLLVLGGLARRARREATLSDFYLAGRSIGFAVLVLTLFATQYSGNSLSGFPGQTYRQGLIYFMSVPFMVAIVSGYTLFAPRLFELARQRRYVTPTDFLADRFGSPVLNYFSAAIFAWTLFNFLLAQLMAMGHAFSGLTDGGIPYATAVILGAAVILCYELLGGMRAVAWTDAVQGLILLLGLGLVLLLLLSEVGPPGEIFSRVAQTAPAKIESPTLRQCLTWGSNLLLLGLGAPLYPQAIQRIYAARRLQALRRSLAVMAVVPLFAITTVCLIGTVGIALFPGLEGPEGDQITFRVLAWLVENEPLARFPVLMVMMAVVAAIMSTADSSLLSASSIFSKDVVGRLRSSRGTTGEQLTPVGPIFSITAMTLLVLIALRPITTLWGLLVIKFEILIQLSPAFILGTIHDAEDPRGFSRQEILAGLIVGLIVALGLYAAGLRSLGGIHPGVVGLATNYLTVLVGRRLRLSRKVQESR